MICSGSVRDSRGVSASLAFGHRIESAIGALSSVGRAPARQAGSASNSSKQELSKRPWDGIRGTRSPLRTLAFSSIFTRSVRDSFGICVPPPDSELMKAAQGQVPPNEHNNSAPQRRKENME